MKVVLFVLLCFVGRALADHQSDWNELKELYETLKNEDEVRDHHFGCLHVQYFLRSFAATSSDAWLAAGNKAFVGDVINERICNMHGSWKSAISSFLPACLSKYNKRIEELKNTQRRLVEKYESGVIALLDNFRGDVRNTLRVPLEKTTLNSGTAFGVMGAAASLLKDYLPMRTELLTREFMLDVLGKGKDGQKLKQTKYDADIDAIAKSDHDCYDKIVGLLTQIRDKAERLGTALKQEEDEKRKLDQLRAATNEFQEFVNGKKKLVDTHLASVLKELKAKLKVKKKLFGKEQPTPLQAHSSSDLERLVGAIQALQQKLAPLLIPKADFEAWNAAAMNIAGLLKSAIKTGDSLIMLYSDLQLEWAREELIMVNGRGKVKIVGLLGELMEVEQVLTGVWMRVEALEKLK